MAKLLIVDDEQDIHQMIRRYAEREGHETIEASDGLEAVALCRENDFDIVIMDIMMPEMDGFTACKEIRKTKDIPMLMLSARGAEYDKLFGFEVGVDDYVVKPFSPKELMARVNVIINRHKAQSGKTAKEQIELGGLRIDKPGRNVFVDGAKTELTTKEYELLVYLAENNGIVVTRDQILTAVWGYDYYGDDRTVDWQIKLLRSKLGDYRNCIVTIRVFL
ncbi:response regulator transcription factor [Clostridium kluyveri]|uniref:Stage 0 sporulation protein A homolog n=1 Tax=Clostridium kluyveri TaxID=1534 RepID=A0A1L5F4F1_CLOKL|nr:response regulator transcription factor [Clostridium kluyveri]APM37730.1 DNA-binding response regulator [Clostridium kluyveri]